MLLQVYFERPVGSSEWGCLPEYCRALHSLMNSNEQTTIINAGIGDNVFAHAGSQSVPVREGLRIPFILPVNPVLQGEQTNQWPDHIFETLGGYTIAGIIIQGQIQIPKPPESVGVIPKTQQARHVAPDALNSLPKPLSEKRFRCSEEGCLDRRGQVPSFSRYSDLLRHIISFHRHSQEFTCIVSGCNTSTKRLDKLKAHLWKKHRDLGFRQR